MTAVASESRRDLRSEILEVATRMFAEQGYNATSIRQVTEAARCTKPALYYYFRSKEELFKVCVDLHLGALSELIQGFVAKPGPIRPRIHASLVAFVDHAQANPAGMQLIQRVDMRPEEGAPDVDVRGSQELHLQMIEHLIRQGVASGEVREGLEPRDAAVALSGTINFQFQLWLHCGEDWSVDQLHRTVDVLFDGIAAR